MPLIRPGTIAWADTAPGQRPPKPRPCIFLDRRANGNALLAFLSHSVDAYRRSVRLSRSLAPSAFAPGSPLTDDEGVIGLVLANGDTAAFWVDPTDSGVRIHAAHVGLSRILHLDAADWLRVRDAVRDALQR